jgi:hypothetical protein
MCACVGGGWAGGGGEREHGQDGESAGRACGLTVLAVVLTSMERDRLKSATCQGGGQQPHTAARIQLEEGGRAATAESAGSRPPRLRAPVLAGQAHTWWA